VEERLGIDMNLYHMPCKFKSGFGFRHTTSGNARLQRSKALLLKQEKFSLIVEGEAQWLSVVGSSP
jgi:hypothetical protein